MKRTMLMITFCVPLVALLGCTGIGNERDVLLLAAVEDDTAYYQHYEILGEGRSKNSLWAVDLETGESREIAPEAKYMIFLAGEDHYAYIVESEEGDADFRLVAVQVSTEEEFEIYTWEKNEENDTPGSAAIHGETVSYIDRDGDLVLFDLSTRSEVDKIALPDGEAWIMDFEPGIVAIQSRPLDSLEPQWVLVNVTEGTYSQTDMPEGWRPFNWSSVANGSVYTILMKRGDSALYGYDIEGETWKKIKEYSDDTPSFQAQFPYFGDASGEKIIIQEIRVSFFEQSSALVLVDLDSGETDSLKRLRGGAVTFALARPIVDEDFVYWIDPMTRSFVVHSLDDGERETIELDYTTD